MDGSDAGGTTDIWFETATVVTTFLLVGRWLEARATDRTRDALRGLLTLGAKDVAVERVDPRPAATTEVRIPVDELAVGDRFVVRPGEKVATDGRVVDGNSAVDASLVTGESIPVDVGPGDEVTGGSVNTTGGSSSRPPGSAPTRRWPASPASSSGPDHEGPVQRLADRVSAVFVPVVLVLARAHLRRLVARHRRPGPGARGRRGRARHRLPLRPGAGHADGAARRHRPRRPARHPHQGRRRARGHPAHRHRRPRQDGHGDDRRDDPRRRHHGRTASPRTRPCARRRGRVGQRAPGRPGDRGRRGEPGHLPARGPATSRRSRAPAPGPDQGHRGHRRPRRPLRGRADRARPAHGRRHDRLGRLGRRAHASLTVADTVRRSSQRAVRDLENAACRHTC